MPITAYSIAMAIDAEFSRRLFLPDEAYLVFHHRIHVVPAQAMKNEVR